MPVNEESAETEQYTGPRTFDAYTGLLAEMDGNIVEVTNEGGERTADRVGKIQLAFEPEKQTNSTSTGSATPPQ
jgi:hypothetical protein